MTTPPSDPTAPKPVLDIYDPSTWQEEPVVPIPISIVQTAPDTVSFQVDGVTYSVKQGDLLPAKVKMLHMGDDFYARFGRGEEVLPQIREFFRKIDAEQGRSVARCYGL